MTKKETRGGARPGAGAKPRPPDQQGKGKQFWLYSGDLEIIAGYHPKQMAAYIRGCIRIIAKLPAEEFDRLCELGKRD